MDFIKQHKLILTAAVTVWLAFAGGQVAWVVLDQSPPLWDMAGHSVRAVVAANYLQQGQLVSVITEDSVYPPAAYLVAAPALALSWAADVPQLSLLFWIALLEIALLLLGHKLFGSSWVGLGAFALTMGYPLPLHFTRIFDLDFPQAAAVTAVVAAAVMSERFTNRRWSLVCGVLLGLALLTKFTAGLFLIGPLVVVGSLALLDAHSRLRALTNLGYVVFMAAALSAPWYILHGGEVLQSSEAAAFNSWSIPFTNLFSFGNTMHYLGLLTAGMGWPLLLAAALAAGVLWRARGNALAQKSGLLLTVWLLVPYALLTYAFAAKEARYILPLYHPLALITAGGLAQLSRVQRVASGIGLGLIGAWFFVSTGFGWQPLSAKVERQLAIDHTYGYQQITPKQPGYGYSWPTQYHSAVRALPQIIRDDLAARGEPARDEIVRVVVLPNSIYLTAQQVQWYALLDGRGRTNGPELEYALSSQVRFGDWRVPLAAADYIIAKEGDQGPEAWGANLKEIRDIEAAAARSDNGESVFDTFDLIGELTLTGIEKKDRAVRLWRRKEME